LMLGAIVNESEGSPAYAKIRHMAGVQAGKSSLSSRAASFAAQRILYVTSDTSIKACRR